MTFRLKFKAMTIMIINNNSLFKNTSFEFLDNHLL